MIRILVLHIGLFLFALLPACAAPMRDLSPEEERTRVDQVLDQLHTAASNAEEQEYFCVFAPSAIFFGTDASERWTLHDFREYASPHFRAGRGWTYTPTQRHIYFSPSGDTAWFDEMLENENYGECRGTGVLIRHAGEWKLAQYHLTVPVPNALLPGVVEQIREQGGEPD